MGYCTLKCFTRDTCTVAEIRYALIVTVLSLYLVPVR